MKRITAILGSILALCFLCFIFLIAWGVFNDLVLRPSYVAPPIPTLRPIEPTVSIDQDCLEDAMHGVPEELSRCDDNSSPPGASRCPYGCDTPSRICIIKGNISFDSGEKIYHVPGGEFYDSTTIDPAYGERWFCTEEEAIANGWRRSSR